ncbi:cysteine desulfurase [Lacihabitans sp. LS3-19]|uniref:cysteine desulfurase family protein n=1 Tax=Lacihabitans sp. LS3-19 TaxID=2487335 RepID=UPI0020CD4AB9|nr:cysteine desulfurase family protein [Lacihabitans sp. LS3-19]MCP9766670.1 cysteine desulfurase [Lacihabitans sp. LS3-19]
MSLKKLPIYLDHAATTPVSPEVLEAMLPYFTENYGNPSSRHHAYGWFAEEAFDTAVEQISKAFKCKKNEVVFTSGATESINLALKGFFEYQPETRFISYNTEHKATLEVAETLKSKGSQVTILGVKPNGDLDLEVLENELKKGFSLLSLMYANNETGLIHPMAEIIKLKEKYDFLLHIDVTQAVGKLDIDFRGIDMLSYSAHKIYGPKGVGGLLVKEGLKLSPQIVGGGQQRSLRSGTLNIPGIVGIGLATKLAQQNIEKYNHHCGSVKSKFESVIKEIFPESIINAADSSRVSNISNVCFTGYDGEDLMLKLHNIAVSNGSACNSATTFPSHVLTAMGLSSSDAFASLRFSFGWGNTMEQLDEVLDWMKEVIG